MQIKGYLVVSSLFFFLVAAMHLVRLVLQVPVQVGPWSVPLWMSVGGVAVPLLLGLLALRLLCPCCGGEQKAGPDSCQS